MPRCAFPGCKNDPPGYSSFPISERRREKFQWLKILGLPQSTSKSARLCEGHFDRDQFEIVDFHGTAKLKSSARPTILTPNPPKVLEKVEVTEFDAVPGTCGLFALADKHSFKTLVQETPTRPEAAMQPKEIRHDITNKDSFSKPSSQQSLLKKKNILVTEDMISEASDQTVKLMMERIQELENDKKKLAAKTQHLENDISHLRESNEKLNIKVHTLETAKKNLSKNLKKILTEEQIRVLELECPSSNQQGWGVHSMKKGIRIRLIAGARGYEALRLHEGWPLPSLRSVNRRLKNFEPTGQKGPPTKKLGLKINKEKSPHASLAVPELIPGQKGPPTKKLCLKINKEKLPHASLAVSAGDKMCSKSKIERDTGLHCFPGPGPDISPANTPCEDENPTPIQTVNITP